MAITSERQRRFTKSERNNGATYFTLFRGEKGERPEWAQDGDILEEYGEDYALVCRRDSKGRIKWEVDESWDRQTGGGSGGDSGGGGSLPANFPAEDILNADKFIGFDENGDYAALDAPSGGGAEKFVVTLTQSGSTWTADKTIAEIVAAYEANQVVVAKYPFEGLYVDVPCLTAATIGEGSGASSVVAFGGNLLTAQDTPNAAFVSIIGQNQETDLWGVGTKTVGEIPTGSNDGDILVWDESDEEWKPESNPYAPLIVTLTLDAQIGSVVGDKTFGEIYEAYTGGQRVRFAFEGPNPMVFLSDLLAVQIESGDYSFIMIMNGEAETVKCHEADLSNYFVIA